MNEAAYQAILNRLGLEPASTTPPASPDWLAAWRTLARVTNGIVKEDSRFPRVMAALSRCDDAYLSNNWPLFQQTARDVHKIVKQAPT